MEFRRFFKLYKNKILAISFASLALIAFFTYYIMGLVQSGISFFTQNEFSIWNMIVVFVAYATIFFCNITNDSYAYQGILMFVFLIVADQILSCFVRVVACIANIMTMNPVVIAFTFLQVAFIAGQIYVGVCFYLNSRRYMRGLTDNFKKLRIYGILFTSMLTLSHAFSIAVLSIDIFGYATVFDWMVFLSLFLLPGSEVLMSLSVNFTLERLRRI